MERGNIKAVWPLLLLIIFSLVSGGTAWGTVLSLNADTRQLKGREFGVTVAVDAVYDAFGIACDMVYDPQFLELVEIGSGTPVQYKVTEGDLFNSDDPPTPTLLRSALEDDMPGILVLGLTRSGNVAGVDTVSKTDIVTVSFMPKKVGNTTITFQAQAILDADEDGIPVDSWDPVSIDITILKGDVDGSFVVDLADAIKAIKILNGIAEGSVNPDADVDEDGKIGLADVIYILQLESETRVAD